MSQILSPEEVNALLKGVAEGEIGAEGGAPSPPRGVRVLDLTSQERSLRGRLPGLELVLDRFIRGLRPSLGAFFGRIPTVTVSGLELIKFARVSERLTQPVSLQVFRMPPLRGHGMVVLRGPLVGTLLQVFFGGNLARTAPVAEREFSSIEQRALERFGARVLADLREAWRPIATLELNLVRSETNPAFAPIAAAQDLVVQLDIQIAAEGAEEGTLSLCIPNAALDPLRPRLQATPGEESEPPPALWAERMRALLAGAELEVAAELGTRRMRVRDVLALAPGDVIPLGTGRDGPVLVRVEGRARFVGAPGMSGGSNAVRVTGRL
jgi:flagellar motor switch protein FliM